MAQFVKNGHLKVRKKCLWALPFCVRHSVSVISWTGSVRVAEVYVLFHHQPTFVVFALDLVRSEPTWLRSAELSSQSTEVFLLHKYWLAKSANRKICYTVSTFSGQSSLGFRFNKNFDLDWCVSRTVNHISTYDLVKFVLPRCDLRGWLGSPCEATNRKKMKHSTRGR